MVAAGRATAWRSAEGDLRALPARGMMISNANDRRAARKCGTPAEPALMAAPPLVLDRIGQIAVPVRDVARATAFYRDTLGMRFLFEYPGLAFFDCGGIRLIMSVPEGAEFDHPASVLYYTVGDIAAAHAALAARGVLFEREPHVIAQLPDRDVWMAFFRDSERNLLALMSEVPR